jgi:hypothetical protein
MSAEAPPGKPAGFAFKPKGKKYGVLPKELVEYALPPELLPPPAPVARAMFAGPKRERVIAAPRRREGPPANLLPRPVTAAAAAVPPALPPDAELAATFLGPVPAAAEPETATAAAVPAPQEVVLPEDLEPDLKIMGELIIEEQTRSPYLETPTEYIPETRRAFANFVKMTYEPFMLKPVGSEDEVEPGDKYPYQKFVREYMRNESPYRGVLVYHGLGSGKTCTAIATAEALFSTANKKIIAMTPFSLRKNFLKEVSFCGFRHYRLNNFWVEFPLDVEEHRMFAEQVLGLNPKFLAKKRSFWAPDFRQTVSNYNDLTSAQQAQIREQILNSLVYHPVNNPTGRIRFINYNGISAKALKKIACEDPTYFDNAVIIVDEIHNLIRLMQGKIDYYLEGKVVAKRGQEETMPAREKVTIGKWRPTADQCVTIRKQERGYSFYRLLLGAVNSKIVGLSGTPMINYPEELGILMNVLHGYIPSYQGVVAGRSSDIQTGIRKVLEANLYTDFISLKTPAQSSGTEVLVTFLPIGVRKVDPENPESGVERIPPEETVPSHEDIIRDLAIEMAKAGLKVQGGPVAMPLLPVTNETFRGSFMNGDKLKNQMVLAKRITGLVSYYKGSRQDLMPRVRVDEVVRVPFSEFQARLYNILRTEELEKKKRKKDKPTTAQGMIDEAIEEGDASTYRMSSRQVCNFAFPEEIVRPRPRTVKEALEEAGSDGEKGIVHDTEFTEVKKEEFPELEDDEDEVEDIEDENAEEEGEEEEGTDGVNGEQSGGQKTLAEIRAEIKAKREAAAAALATEAETTVAPPEEEEGEPETEAPPPPPPKKTLAQTLAAIKAKKAEEAKKAEDAAQAAMLLSPLEPKKPKPVTKKAAPQAAITAATCAEPYLPGESYKQACARIKDCLRTLFRRKLVRGAVGGLETYSPKFAAMLERIEALPGSSLVYSQFLDMEGIGIFRIAMDVNGYAPIEIVRTGAGLAFSPATIESLAKGPGGQYRYMTFSGEEDEEVRRTALDVFNARIQELPDALKQVLINNGYTDNQTGQLARVFCITSAGAEGLSLKNVRGVHIMEPYWNDVRTKQVKGRAIRIGSHLELPESERDVSIYTYVMCYDEASQAGAGADFSKISQQIRLMDKLPCESAMKFGLPCKDPRANYTLTSDEYLYTISQIKKNVIDSLEQLMKASAIDCELNIAQNRGDNYQCIILRGKVGDFLYHPDLQTDITESAAAYEAPAKPAPTATGYFKITFKGVTYRAVEDKIAGGFKLFGEDETDYEGGRVYGTTGAAAGRPSKPIVIF